MPETNETPSTADAHVCSTDLLGPLPGPYGRIDVHDNDPRWQGSIDGWNADQMRAYALQERDRCLDVRLSDDDALRFACRVLESDAPAADKAAARDGLMAIRTRIRA
jgi:hypothetical protein